MILVPWADRSAPSVEGCSAKSLDQMSTSNDQQKINVKTKRKATIKFQHLHKYNATTLCNICIAYSSTNILQRSSIYNLVLGLGTLLCSKLLWFFLQKFAFLMASAGWSSCGATRNGVVGKFWQKGDQWLYCFDTPPHSADIYLSNIFVFLWASFTSTRYTCLEMLYRFNRIIHLHNQKIYFSNMVVFLYTPSQCSFDRYICQILFPFFDSPTQ